MFPACPPALVRKKDAGHSRSALQTTSLRSAVVWWILQRHLCRCRSRQTTDQAIFGEKTCKYFKGASPTGGPHQLLLAAIVSSFWCTRARHLGPPEAKTRFIAILGRSCGHKCGSIG
ncbi:hypothetical protein MTO96_009166 [Rhipicephalus appendiculatus]